MSLVAGSGRLALRWGVREGWRRQGMQLWRGIQRGACSGVLPSKRRDWSLVDPKRRSLFSSLNPFSGYGGEVEAKKHIERRLVNFSPDEVYRVVVNVDEYSQFVPWCTASRVVRTSGNQFYADLAVGFKMLSETYTSLVTAEEGKFVKVQVKSNNLFEFLVNEWVFEPGPRAGTTWIDFVIAFKFKNHMYQGLTNVFFEQVASKMVEAFELRCVEKYSRQRMQI